MAENITDQIISLQKQLTQAQNDLANAIASQVGNEARRDDWMQNYRGPGHSQEADRVLREVAEIAAQLTERISQLRATVKTLTEQLDVAHRDQANLNAARAQAAAEGLDGAAAEERAKSLVESEKAKKWVYIIAAVVVGLIGLFWGWHKYAKAK